MKVNRYIFTLLTLATTLLYCGCGSKSTVVDNSHEVMVAIEPLKYLVEVITDNDFNINVIVPAGEGPETYSPTPSQMARIEDSELIFATGLLNFEQELIKHNNHKNNNIHHIISGIDLITSTEHEGAEHDHHGHHHGTDPHVWLSFKELQTVVNNITDVFMAAYPDSIKYRENANRLIDHLKVCDVLAESAIAKSGTKAFAIYHPALSYYARDYGLEQVAVEDEGKEPNLARLKSSINHAKSLNINKVLYQREYPVSVVENFAADLGATPEMIDPLSSDIITELSRITTLITDIEIVIHPLTEQTEQ